MTDWSASIAILARQKNERSVYGRCRERLESIGDYIAGDNPLRALSIVRELRIKCMNLADLPNGFPLVPCYERHGVRRRAHGDFLIFYRVEAEQVVILHILHGAMDYIGILFPS